MMKCPLCKRDRYCLGCAQRVMRELLRARPTVSGLRPVLVVRGLEVPRKEVKSA